MNVYEVCTEEQQLGFFAVLNWLEQEYGKDHFTKSAIETLRNIVRNSRAAHQHSHH